jgi:hypothetical protein
MKSGGTEIEGMMGDYFADEVAPGALMCVLFLSTTQLRSLLTLHDTSVATATETCTDVGTVQ